MQKRLTAHCSRNSLMNHSKSMLSEGTNGELHRVQGVVLSAAGVFVLIEDVESEVVDNVEVESEVVDNVEVGGVEDEMVVLIVDVVVEVDGEYVVVVVVNVVEEDGEFVVVLWVRLVRTMRVRASRIEENRGKTILPSPAHL